MLEAPDGGIVLGEAHGRGVGYDIDGIRSSLGNDGHLDVRRTGLHALGHEHIVEAVGIGIAAQQTGHHIAGGVGAEAALAQSPAQLVAVVLADDAALALFPAAAAVDVPAADVLELGTRLVGHLQVGHLATVQVSQHDVAFGTLGVDAHLTDLGDTGIAVRAQLYADVEVVESRTGKKICC